MNTLDKAWIVRTVWTVAIAAVVFDAVLVTHQIDGSMPPPTIVRVVTPSTNSPTTLTPAQQPTSAQETNAQAAAQQLPKAVAVTPRPATMTARTSVTTVLLPPLTINVTVVLPTTSDAQPPMTTTPDVTPPSTSVEVNATGQAELQSSDDNG